MANEDRMETVAGALKELGQLGFDRNMSVAAGRLRVAGAGRTYGPGEAVIREHRRFEGVSDPDDTSVVYAIETSDGLKGTLVDGYNAYADPSVSEFLSATSIAEDSARDPKPTRVAFEKPTALPGR